MAFLPCREVSTPAMRVQLCLLHIGKFKIHPKKKPVVYLKLKPKHKWIKIRKAHGMTLHKTDRMGIEAKVVNKTESIVHRHNYTHAQETVNVFAVVLLHSNILSSVQ